MSVRRTQRLRRASALGAVSALLLTGCLSSSSDESSGGGGEGGKGDKNVEIMYAFVNEQDKAFQASMKDFEAKEGIKIKFSPTPGFDKLIRSRVQGNNLPDIALFPQPGIALDIARSGKLADLNDLMDLKAVKDVPGILDAATDAEGHTYAAPMGISVKSLVWYPKPAFTDAGYTIPKSEAELLALTKKIKADGTTPWCVGIENQTATGWAATDWMEDYVLRFGGAAGYDKWVKHEIPFNDPLVLQAGNEIAKIWFPPGNVFGGRKSIASTAVLAAGNGMFADPPKCYLHRQASFLTLPGAFPKDVVKNLDDRVGVFPLPPIEAGSGQPILGGGDVAGLFSKGDTAAEKTIKYIIGDGYPGYPEAGGYISPHTNFDLSKYPNKTMQDIAKIAYSASEFRFDGSDLMPGEVGAGSFWRGMVEWVNGKELKKVLDEIEASWPSS
jgi:alpha-glucoside transport system substrate-binding protein